MKIIASFRVSGLGGTSISHSRLSPEKSRAGLFVDKGLNAEASVISPRQNAEMKYDVIWAAVLGYWRQSRLKPDVEVRSRSCVENLPDGRPKPGT